jgi:ferredoxin
VILKWLSRLSLLHASISPDSCVQCRLCEEACPFDAIRPASPPRKAPLSRGEKRGFAAALTALPVLVALGAYAGILLAPTLAQVHPTVRLAEQVAREDAGLTKTTTLESDTFRSQKTTTDELVKQAAAVRNSFAWGSPVFGGFVMLVFTLGFLGSFLRRGKPEYHPDRGECFSCGRCFSYCPREHLRLKERPGLREHLRLRVRGAPREKGEVT